jgi:hypothetical protein
VAREKRKKSYRQRKKFANHIFYKGLVSRIDKLSAMNNLIRKQANNVTLVFQGYSNKISKN